MQNWFVLKILKFKLGILNKLNYNKGIQSLFVKINCDRSQIDILLLNKDGVTESNMSQYLGIIDSRTDELLKWQSILASKVLTSNITSKLRVLFKSIFYFRKRMFLLEK